MKRMGVICLGIFVLYASGAVAQEDAACRFIRDGLSLYGETKEEMIATLGEPEKSATEELASMWYEGQVDVVTSLWYPGLYLETLYLYQGENSIEYPLTVDVTGESIEIPFELGIGVTRERVLAVLGKPVMISDEDGSWLYGCGMEEAAFYFSGDRLNRIVFRGYFP